MDTYVLTLTDYELRAVESALLRERARFMTETTHYREISQQLAEAGDSSGARAALHRSGRMRAAYHGVTAILRKIDEITPDEEIPMF